MSKPRTPGIMPPRDRDRDVLSASERLIERSRDLLKRTAALIRPTGELSAKPRGEN